MGSVVICEKPSQARNVQEAVGSKYGRVLSARGHLLRLMLPEEANPNWAKWGFDILRPESGFYPFVADKTGGKDKVLSEIKEALASADRVIIATDCDREGQAIGENIVRHLKFRGEVFRVMFSAEDAESLREAFAKMRPNREHLPLYQAAYARAQSDQIANLSMTRAATLALKPASMRGALGIGRVKTPTMAIVCRREAEIGSFTPRDYFDFYLNVSDGKDNLRLEWTPKPEVRVFDKNEAQRIVAGLDGWTGPVSVKKERKRQAPPKLMDLPTLQERAARWGWSAKRTLDTAQALYETHKVTTYPRAENRYLPEVEADNARAMLTALRGLPFVKVSFAEPVIRKGKAGVFSDAGLAGASHHAIAPNFKTRASWPDALARMSEDEGKLFELIAQSYVAAVGPDRVYDRTEIGATVGERLFSASGVVQTAAGWREAMGADAADDERPEDEEGPNNLPAWPDGHAVQAVGAGADRKTTKPPPRYTEGSLIKAMKEAWRFAENEVLAARLKEAKGIGTPATRDTVIEGLKRQNYFEVVKGQLKASELAMAVYELLQIEAPEVLDPASTAEMEMALDEIERGSAEPRAVVDRLVGSAAALVTKLRDLGEHGKPLDVTVKAKPSPAMLKAARAKAERQGVKLPRGASADAEICRAFLGPRPEGNGPSEAAVSFARKIADATGQELPTDLLEDRAGLTKWIDANKGRMAEKSGSDEVPTPKQVEFAEKIAAGKGVVVPDEIMRSRSRLSKWIDAHAAKTGGKRNRSK